MKSIISFLLAILAPLVAFPYSDPSGVWTYHPSAGTEINRIFATPGLVYYITYNQPYYSDVPENSVPYSTVHVYDKNADELRTLSKASGLTDNSPVLAEYNPTGKYLALAYADGNIDLLHDDGSVTNVHGLKNAEGINDKGINSISFDQSRNLMYVATNFGYFSIDDKRGEIEESRIFRFPLLAVARAGDWFLAVDADGRINSAPMSANRMSWDDFSPMPQSKPVYRLLPLSGNVAGAMASENNAHTLLYVAPSANEVRELRTMYNISCQALKDGYFIGSSNRGIKFRDDGGYDMVVIPSPESDSPHAMASADMREFWFATPLKGFYSRRYSDSDGSSWGNPTSPRRPSGPHPFLATDIALHPTRGFLVPNHGINHIFSSQSHPESLLLSALKDGGWSHFDLRERIPSQTEAFASPNGIAIDPDNPDIIYFGSLLNGFFRMNLTDPSDVLHLSRPDSRWDALPGFVKVHEVNTEWKNLSQISYPVIDNAGNLWTVFNDYKAANPAQLWVWSADARKSSTKPSSVRPMNHITVRGTNLNPGASVLPLKHASNANTVVFHDSYAGSSIVILNHQGTLNTTSDDRTYTISLSSLLDSEGQLVNSTTSKTLFEDPETGLVWVGTESGIFSFSPSGALAGNPQIRQFKIARNDGTGLADYLLSGITVFDIMADPKNRKWISTGGAGLVCVSPDGSEIITSCTTSNSDIPSDVVYKAVYSPDIQTMLVATDAGLAEYRPYNVGDGTDFENARAYPNPVRPDYLGYVTIDGLVDNAIVKIADARGRLVRELGFAANGLVRWDVCDMQRRRVGSGVYFVLASTGPDDDSLSKVAKILVVN